MLPPTVAPARVAAPPAAAGGHRGPGICRPLRWWSGTCTGWYDSRWRHVGWQRTSRSGQAVRLGCRESRCAAGQE